MQKLVIERNQWLRGTDSEQNDYTAMAVTLENECHVRQCCLGHLLTKLHDVPQKDLEDKATPVEYFESINDEGQGARLNLSTLLRMEGQKGVYGSSAFAEKAISINDDHPDNLTDEEKEQQLIQLFATQNIALSFVDE